MTRASAVSADRKDEALKMRPGGSAVTKFLSREPVVRDGLVKEEL
jgi:hypothetical protein